MQKLRTHYDNLKVARDAPDIVIRAAYRSLCQQYHPDKNPGDARSAKITQLINDSYAVLMDPDRRRQHDEWIAAAERKAEGTGTRGPEYGRSGANARQRAAPDADVAEALAEWERVKKADALQRKALKFLGMLALLALGYGFYSSMVRKSEVSYAPYASSGVVTPPSEGLPEIADPVPELDPSIPTEANPIIAYVVAERANVRSGPDTTFQSVAQLSQLDAVKIVGVQGSWSEVQLYPEGEGFILSELILIGGTEDARTHVCEPDESQRPNSGEILKQEGRGSHRLAVNAPRSDVLVKLRRNGSTVLAFFVRGGESGGVRSVPEGEYEFMYATGTTFSRKCLEFFPSMRVSGDPNPISFRTTRSGSTVSSVVAEYTLTEIADGNFTPVTKSEEAFRE